MRLTVVPILFLLASLPLSALAEDEGLETRFGTVRVVTDDSNPGVHRVQVGKRKFLKFEGERIELREVLQDEGRDFVIVREHFGVSACPYNFAILELSEDKVRMSPEFGTCSDADAASLDGGRVTIEMPFYTEHPEGRDGRDLKAAQTKLLVYSWKAGKLSAFERKKRD